MEKLMNKGMRGPINELINMAKKKIKGSTNLSSYC